jgi:hypothetical protein
MVLRPVIFPSIKTLGQNQNHKTFNPRNKQKYHISNPKAIK